MKSSEIKKMTTRQKYLLLRKLVAESDIVVMAMFGEQEAISSTSLSLAKKSERGGNWTITKGETILIHTSIMTG